MRTTVDIPDALFRRAKAAAALEGKSLKTYFTEALEQRLGGGPSEGGARRVSLPLVMSSSPGSLRLTSDDVARALEAEEGDVPT